MYLYMLYVSYIIYLLYIYVYSGCGVTPEDMQVMFNAYQQISSGVSKTYQGTGLGLHIVRLHVEIMSGMLGTYLLYMPTL